MIGSALQSQKWPLIGTINVKICHCHDSSFESEMVQNV